MSAIRLIVGLGNPGPEYALTRHNAGALWVAYLAQDHGLTLRPDKKLSALYGRIQTADIDVHLLFPQTFMNRSGTSVQAACQFYKIQPEEILVAHDELDLPCGSLRLKKGGGHGGHNGLRDIISKFGGNKEFARLRLGIGHPGHKERVHGHVLGKLNNEEADLLEDTFRALRPELVDLIRDNWSGPMNRLHQIKPPSPQSSK